MRCLRRIVCIAIAVERLEQPAICRRATPGIATGGAGTKADPARVCLAVSGGVEVFVPQHEVRRDAVQHFAHVRRVDLHIDGTERGTVALDGVVEGRHFQPVVGQHRDPPARADAFFGKEARKPVRQPPELAEGNAAGVFFPVLVPGLIDADDERLVATDLSVFAQHRRDAAVAGLVRGCWDVARCHGVF